MLSIDHERGRARIRQPLPENCIINIMRRSKGQPNLAHEDREVRLADLELPPESLT